MTTYIRVKDKATGHEYSVPEGRFNADAHTKLDKPATRGGEPLPVKYKTTVAKKAAGKQAAKSADQSDNTTSPKEGSDKK